MREITVRVHEIAADGLPDEDNVTGSVAFIFDGCIVSGWPLGTGEDADGPYTGYWEADSDVGRHVKFANVTHWIEFPEPLHQVEQQ